MKIKLVTFLFIVFMTKLFSQEGFNYQAILYDDNGDILRNRTVDLRLTISGETQPSNSQADAYIETHNVDVGEDGVINVILGNGTVQSALIFSEINWGNPPLYIQREVDFGQGFQILGYSQILSVPVAEYSKKTGSLSLFDSRKNVIENSLDPKSPSLEMSPSGAPTSTLNIGSQYSSNNVMLGNGSGGNLTLGYDNIGLGFSALASVTSSYGNIAMGRNSLRHLTDYESSGVYNVAIGYRSLEDLTSGWVNIGIGSTALMHLTQGSGNVAIGAGTLEDLVQGENNVALGVDAMNESEFANQNTALGRNALFFSNQSGTITATLGDFSYTASKDNTAVGFGAMQNNNLGSFNVALGTYSLQNNGLGFNNTGIGLYTLQNNTDGVDNTAVGWGALMNSENSNGNTALGGHSGQYLADSSNNNTFIGNYSGVSEANSNTQIHNAIAIGAQATVAASNTFVLGSESINYWSFGRESNDIGKVIQVGTDSSNGNGAYLSSGGVWTNASSIKFKTSFSDIVSKEVLSQLNKLVVKRWRYKGTNEYHIGPFAEQFTSLFDLGVVGDKEHISTMDLAGVSIIGIQEQSKMINDLKKENDSIKKENHKIKAQLELIIERLKTVEFKLEKNK